MDQKKAIKLIFLLSIILFVVMLAAPVSATYSIIAVDPVTGTIGSAGGSCINGSIIISDVIDGVGAVHTQAYYIEQNQLNAHDLLAGGATPQEIIDWVTANDAEANPAIRQYGAVTLAGDGASAAYTGSETTDWAGHITGPGYSIQGNILAGSEIVEDMEAAYLSTAGPMEDKLMAALNAADVPGADTRCLSCNKPTISAFIRVFHLGDGEDPYLDLNINTTPCSINPMDLLRSAYDSWKEQQYADAELSTVDVDPLSLMVSSSDSAVITIFPKNSQGNPPSEGVEVTISNTGPGSPTTPVDNGDGTFTSAIQAPDTPGPDTIIVTATGGGNPVELLQKPVVLYYRCGDTNNDEAVNIGDAVYLINLIFGDGPGPIYQRAGDVNCDGGINVGDAVYLVNLIFREGSPVPCAACP